MNNTEVQTVETVAKDQTITDVVRESPVDTQELKTRKILGISALVVILVLFLIALF